MKARDLFSKVLSLALVAVMLLGMLPLSASAAETVDGSKVEGGMYMNKYTTLESDGTYTITLEAFATGTTTTTTETQAVPLDIVLVLDQSGSMENSISGADSRMAALINAVESFIDSVHDDAVENEVDHRIAIVGFASTGNSYTNTEILSTNYVVNYGSATNSNYADAMVSVNNNGAVNSRLTTAVDRLETDGDTYSEYGFDMANKIFAQNSIEGTDRQRVVVMFTDGYTAPSGTNDFKYEMANNAIANAKISKDTYGATVYSVAVLNGADPTADINSNFVEDDGWSDGYWSSGNDLSSQEELTAMNRYMHFASSNYPSAQSLQNGGTRDEDKECYLVASDSAGLLAVFQSIFEDVIESASSVTLDETSVTKDIVEPSAFNLPDGYNEDSNIKTYTEVVTATETDGVTTYTRSGERVAYEDATIVVDDVANTIEVSNFDYAENFVAPSREGLMLIIEIKGIEVTDIGFARAEDDGLVDSNAAGSGIYSADGVLLFPFVKPNVELGNKSYVVDYAKQFEMLVSEWGMASAGYIAKDTAAIKGAQTGLDLTYGDVAQVDTTKYTYTPNNMNWDGFDTFYAFGTDSDSALNKWAKVNVIPANNVYYEDSFVTNESTGVVGIEYAGDFQVVGVAGNNTESANTPVHGGWIEGSLGDDAEYSDGTATEMAKGATATFTFTGTGLDIYSRTNIKTGAVRAILRNADDAIEKYMIVDNLAESGDYYQIPTLSFQDLTYGTYTVELKVNAITNVVEGERSTYYLDGIRVYNPLGTSSEDPVADETVKDAYKDELNAVFTEVRDILIDAGSFTEDSNLANGVVFLDDYTVDGDNGTTETDVAIYEDYGPKNEVYLAPGQAIAFKVQSGKNYYVGIKAPEGATTVQYTNGANVTDYPVEHSTDLYYTIVPNADGLIMIKNTDTNNTGHILSITKLRTTDASAATAESGIETASLDEILTYASTFSQLSRVDAEVAPMEPPVEENAPVVEPEEPETEVEVEVEVEIEIENPDEVEEPETEEPAVDPKAEEVAKLVKKIFDAFRGWFGR